MCACVIRKQPILDAVFEVFAVLNSGPAERSYFDDVLSKNGLSIAAIQQITSFSLLDTKENEVYLTDIGKEWFCHLGYLLKKRSFRSLMEFYHRGTEPHLVHDAVSFIMTLIEKLPKLDSFWICSPWISIEKQSRPRFKQCLRKIKHIQIITRPPEKTTSANIRSSVEDSLGWLLEQGVDKISLHDNVHAKVYLIEESINSWRNRAMLIGSENFTFSANPELSLCIFDDRLFREARARLASLITDKRFTA
jgi:hypothetical protein